MNGGPVDLSGNPALARVAIAFHSVFCGTNVADGPCTADHTGPITLRVAETYSGESRSVEVVVSPLGIIVSAFMSRDIPVAAGVPAAGMRPQHIFRGYGPVTRDDKLTRETAGKCAICIGTAIFALLYGMPIAKFSFDLAQHFDKVTFEVEKDGKVVCPSTSIAQFEADTAQPLAPAANPLESTPANGPAAMEE